MNIAPLQNVLVGFPQRFGIMEQRETNQEEEYLTRPELFSDLELYGDLQIELPSYASSTLHSAPAPGLSDPMSGMLGPGHVDSGLATRTEAESSHAYSSIEPPPSLVNFSDHPPPSGRASRETGVKEPPGPSQGSKHIRSDELDRLILRLREENPEMSWNLIASNISAFLGERVQVPALQMRYNRFRKRLESRNLGNEELLRKAVNYYDTNKWEIIAEKMTELGATRRWTAEDCELLWLKMEMNRLSSSRKSLEQPEEEHQRGY